MSFTFTITCNTAEEIERVLAALKHSADPAITAQVETAAVDAGTKTVAGATDDAAAEQPKRRGRPPREKAPEQAPPLTEGDLPQDPPFTEREQPEKVNADKKVTLDDARAALRGLQSRIGEDDMATAIAVLKEFGATRISEVKPEQYADFIGACAKAG